MKKNICCGLFFFILHILILSCAVSNYKAVLSEDNVKSFIENHERLFAEITAADIKAWIAVDNEISMSDLFKAMYKKTPPKKIQTIFKQNGLNPKLGHLQIAVLQYGIVTDTIEKTLAEISNEERTQEQKENDKQTAGWLNEIKSQINSDDYELIKKYSAELYEIFNQLENNL